MDKDEMIMENLNRHAAMWGATFSELELQLYQLSVDSLATQFDRINELSAMHDKIKMELIEGLRSIDDAMLECKRSGDKAWFIAKYKIINDYAIELILSFKQAVDRVWFSSKKLA